MAGAYWQPDGGDWPTAESEPAGTDAAELIAQIRQLAADADPAGVQQVIADVLSALDRAAGGALREQLEGGLPQTAEYDHLPINPSPDPLIGYDEPPVSLTDLEAAGEERRPTEPG
jgi:hypothetical protein